MPTKEIRKEIGVSPRGLIAWIGKRASQKNKERVMRIEFNFSKFDFMLEAFDEKLKSNTPSTNSNTPSADEIIVRPLTNEENPHSSIDPLNRQKSTQGLMRSPAAPLNFGGSVFKNPAPELEMAYVNQNFNHEINGNAIKSTDSKSYMTTSGSHHPTFTNEYHSEKWVMLYNAKYPLFTCPNEVTEKIPYNASTVIQKQYELVSLAKGFYGALPEAITRKSVVNFDTLQQTQGKQGEEMISSFLNTSNGKHTKHIADLMGKEITEVRREDGEFFSSDFHIKLSNQKIETPLENTTSDAKRKIEDDEENRRTKRTRAQSPGVTEPSRRGSVQPS